jgi:hypothetical protein
MKASDYGIKNLKRILPNINQWSAENGESYQELEELYLNVMGQYRRYMGHVTKYVGGVYDSPKTYDMPGNQFEIVPKNLQKDAVSFLNTQLFQTPSWLLDQNILNKIKPENGVEALKSMQDATLSSLLAGDRAVRLLESASANATAYSLDELMTDLRSGIFAELKSKNSIDIYRRNLQKLFVDRVVALLNPGRTFVRSIPVGVTYGFNTRSVDLSQTDLPSLARGHLQALKTDLKSSSLRMTDKVSKYHVDDLVARIEKALNPNVK